MMMKMISLVVLVGMLNGIDCVPLVPDPCGGSNMVPGTAGSGVAGIQLDLQLVLKSISSLAEQAASLSREIQKTYKTNFLHSAVPSSSIKLQGFIDEERNKTEVGATLKTDYENVMKIMQYTKGINLDEDTPPSLQDAMVPFKHKVAVLICKIKIASEINGQNIVLRLTPDITTPRVYNRFLEFQRAYLIFRDAENYLNEISNGYD